MVFVICFSVSVVMNSRDGIFKDYAKFSLYSFEGVALRRLEEQWWHDLLMTATENFRAKGFLLLDYFFLRVNLKSYLRITVGRLLLFVYYCRQGTLFCLL
jgi:hypothetical protein